MVNDYEADESWGGFIKQAALSLIIMTLLLVMTYFGWVIVQQKAEINQLKAQLQQISK